MLGIEIDTCTHRRYQIVRRSERMRLNVYSISFGMDSVGARKDESIIPISQAISIAILKGMSVCVCVSGKLKMATVAPEENDKNTKSIARIVTMIL